MARPAAQGKPKSDATVRRERGGNLRVELLRDVVELLVSKQLEDAFAVIDGRALLREAHGVPAGDREDCRERETANESMLIHTRSILSCRLNRRVSGTCHTFFTAKSRGFHPSRAGRV